MTRFYHTRAKRIVEIPDHLADEYERRRWYQRLPDVAGKPAVSSGIAVPTGTVAEVLDWVGIDDRRRQAALTAEKAGKNRATLLKALTPP